MLRLDAYLAEVVRLDQLADRAAGVEAGLAVDQAALRGRVRQLENRGQLRAG